MRPSLAMLAAVAALAGPAWARAAAASAPPIAHLFQAAAPVVDEDWVASGANFTLHLRRHAGVWSGTLKFNVGKAAYVLAFTRVRAASVQAG